MNTIRSTWIGWTTLSIAGAGAYYFAKQSINADRQAKYDKVTQRRYVADNAERRSRLEEIKHGSGVETGMSAGSLGKAKGGKKDPSDEASAGPAPGEGSEAAADGENAPKGYVRERSQYEAKPFVSKKGDRFS